MSMINSPRRRASFLNKLELQNEKKEYLKGKSIIYKQYNFEKHEQPHSDILNRYNPNMIDYLSRTELRESVIKLKDLPISSNSSPDLISILWLKLP